MATPPRYLINAIRAGTAVRHLFFKLEHPAGTVLAWDGVGSFVFEGETYLGIAGAGRLSGASVSRDLQTHELVATLNGVPLGHVPANAGQVRNASAKLTAVLLGTGSGSVVASRVMFAGLGDYLVTNFDESTVSLELHIRGPSMDWNGSPKAYYTFNDQRRLFPGDTGFSQVASLENATVAGWSKDPETTGDRPLFRYKTFIGSVSSRVIGSDTLSLDYLRDATGLRRYTDDIYWREEDTGAIITVDTTTGEMRCGGLACAVDVFGDVRTAGGKLVVRRGETDQRMRLAGSIASVGTPTAVTCIGIHADPPLWISAGTGEHVFDAKRGRVVRSASSANVTDPTTYTATYVEETTGRTATIAGGGDPMVAGASGNVFVSTTGVLLTAAGNRIYRAGGTPSADYLRIWT